MGLSSSRPTTLCAAVVLLAQHPGYTSCQASGSSSSSSSSHPQANEADGVAISYDCGTQLYEWRTAWSATKKRWCCRHVDVGCEVDPVNALESEEQEQEDNRRKEQKWLSGISGRRSAEAQAVPHMVAQRRREEEEEGLEAEANKRSHDNSNSNSNNKSYKNRKNSSNNSNKSSDGRPSARASGPPPPPPPPLDEKVSRAAAADEMSATVAAADAEEAALEAEVVRSDNLSELEKENADLVRKTTTTEPFDCAAAAANWQREWSPLKMRYCCVTKGFACVKGLETAAPARKEVTEMLRTATSTTLTTTTTHLSLVIREGKDGRPLTEYVPFEAGEYNNNSSLPGSTDGSGGCSETCLFNGLEGSCEVTMRWYVTHSLKQRSDACGIAERMVHIQCPICSTCRLSDDICQASKKKAEGSATNSSAGLQTWGTPEDPRTLQRQIEEALKESLLKAARPIPCSDDPKSWNRERREHCCQEYGRGCPSFDEDSLAFDCQLERDRWYTAWSPQKKAWCCKHSGIGCPPDPRPEGPPPPTAPQLQTLFDCSRDDSSTWTTTKRVWCCQRAKLGCTLSHDEVPYELRGGEWMGPVPKLGVMSPRLGSDALEPIFDCFSGTWQEWSHEQNSWCCEHKGLGLGCDRDSESYIQGYQTASGTLLSLGASAIVQHPTILLAALAVGMSSFFVCLALGKGSQKPVQGLLQLQAAVREASTARGGLDFVTTVKVTARQPLYEQVSSDCERFCLEDSDDDYRDDEEEDLEAGGLGLSDSALPAE